MKKILVLVLVLCTFMSGTAQALELEWVGPETSFLDSLNRDVTDDVEHLKGIAFSYSDRYIVTEEEYLDISSIDKFYTELSKELTIEELDSGKTSFSTENVLSEKLKKELNLIKVLGGFSGVTVNFEPVCYYNIYRNISLVGGYTQYRKTHHDADSAYWQYVCRVEELTKEVIPYHMRLALLVKTRQMYKNISSDNRFKIFLLVDGKINSVWEREDD